MQHSPSGRLLGVDVHVGGVAKEANSLLLLPLLGHLGNKGKRFDWQDIVILSTPTVSGSGSEVSSQWCIWAFKKTALGPPQAPMQDLDPVPSTFAKLI